MAISANKSSLKITDLGFDCLLICLRHLSFEELLNVADSNKELRHAARYLYKQIYGQKLVRLSQVLKFRGGCSRCCHRLYNGRFRLTDKMIGIYQLKFGLRFLRCFGEEVSEIELIFCYKRHYENDPFYEPKRCKYFRKEIMGQYDKADEWEHLLVEYLNEYCTESLRKIKFNGNLYNYLSSELNKLTKSFVNVEKFESDILFPAQNKLHELFPNLRELELNNLKVPWSKSHENLLLNNEFMANRFSYLEHLKIDLESKYECSNENFAIALLLSPQIKTLQGNVWFEVLFDQNNFNLWNSNEHFQNLERLHLEVSLDLKPQLIEILKKPVAQDLHLKNLKELNIKFKDYNVRDDVTDWMFPFTCDTLESLTLSADKSKLKQFSSLLNKHPTVKKIEIEYSGLTMTNDDCLQISEAFPLLEEFFFKKIADDIVKAVKMFHSLKYFKYCTWPLDSTDVTELLKRSLDGWSFSNAILTRKNGKNRFVEGKRNN